MKWVGHILRKEDSFLAWKMRMQKPYEEGSILLDAPQHDTMDELAELARDKEEWQGTANATYPAKRRAIAGGGNSANAAVFRRYGSKAFCSLGFEVRPPKRYRSWQKKEMASSGIETPLFASNSRATCNAVSAPVKGCSSANGMNPPFVRVFEAKD